MRTLDCFVRSREFRFRIIFGVFAEFSEIREIESDSSFSLILFLTLGLWKSFGDFSVEFFGDNFLFSWLISEIFENSSSVAEFSESSTVDFSLLFSML